ncbi:unnamed protein product [Rotaria sp. Silwood1]|nr:unnamed protein product [Rotaria sp. Silwood1]
MSMNRTSIQTSTFHNGHSSSGQSQLIHSSSSTNQKFTIIPPTLKVFFLCSGLLYFLLVIVNIGLDIGLIFNSRRTWYLGFGISGVLISSGISTLIVTCQPIYAIIYLLWAYLPALVVSLGILIASIVNLALYKRCNSIASDTNCETELAYAMKVVLLVMFILSLIHNIVNLIVIKKTSTTNTAKTSPIPHD